MTVREESIAGGRYRDRALVGSSGASTGERARSTAMTLPLDILYIDRGSAGAV
jgi:hypothetical protein